MDSSDTCPEQEQNASHIILPHGRSQGQDQAIFDQSANVVADDVLTALVQDNGTKADMSLPRARFAISLSQLFSPHPIRVILTILGPESRSHGLASRD